MTTGDQDIYTLIGNGVMSIIGLIFVSDADARQQNFKAIKKLWIVFWSSLILLYFSYVLTSSPLDNWLWAIFNGVSTSAVVIIFLHVINKEKSQMNQWIIFGVALVLIVLFSRLDTFYNEQNFSIQVIAYVLVNLPFILMAWSYRFKHWSTALIFFAYGVAQLPIILIKVTEVGKPNPTLDFALLIAAKITLIGAIYRTMGIRDSED